MIARIDRRQTLAQDVVAIFDPERFAIPRLPVIIGALNSAIPAMPACLDMLIMIPDGAITLPEPYASCDAIASFMQQALDHQHNLLSDWRTTRYLYLTVDRRRLQPGLTHRNAGWHFDGMQGARYPQKLAACHQYVCSDALPTEFSAHPVDARDLDANHHNWFEELGRQIPDGTEHWRPQPLEIVCMSAYQLHRSPIANVDGWRTFIRLDVSCKMQDRLGNTPNPVLPAPFEYVPRSLPDGLGRPVSDSSWDGAARFL